MSAVASCLRKDAAPDEVIDVMVTCDGTWSKRGHTALLGVVVVASWETGQVLEVLSKWCNQCQEKKKEYPDTLSAQFLDWWDVHQSSCGQNFIGSSGVMEKEGALTIWKRSIEKHKLRYTTIISDGDAVTFPALSRAEPYGKNHLISKQEYVGHVQKRMMSHLKAVKLKPHFLPDGKRVRMGRKGRLTDKLMNLFQHYFGKVIRSHPNDARGMKGAVMAIYFHSISMDAHPQHHMCPTEPTSWCMHNRALPKERLLHPTNPPSAKRSPHF